MEHSLDGMQRKELKSMSESGRAGSNICMGVGAHDESLLPGLPNHITLDLIAPRLPWRTFYVLSTVSPAWLHAIRSHEVYNARIRANSTETLALIKYAATDGDAALALSSTTDSAYYELPPMEHYERGCCKFCRFVTIDSKLYVLDNQFVHVMDLAGQHGWKQCARLPEGVVAPFACGVLHGKIYVFGSTFGRNHFFELFDPEENTWAPVTPMPYCRYDYYHTVTTVGEELFVHGLKYSTDSDGSDGSAGSDGSDANSLEVYHPIEDEWRMVEPFETEGGMVPFFVARGKLHSIGDGGIYTYDVAKNSWTRVHSHSVSGISKVGPHVLSWNAVQAVGDEVLATVTLITLDSRRTCLVRSKGIGGGKEEVAWEEVQCAPPFRDWPSSSCYFGIYPIQL